jgi:hypothetical protein
MRRQQQASPVILQAPVDSLLQEQQAAAAEDNISAIRKSLGYATAQLFQRFGSRQLAGNSLRPPILGI